MSVTYPIRLGGVLASRRKLKKQRDRNVTDKIKAKVFSYPMKIKLIKYKKNSKFLLLSSRF